MKIAVIPSTFLPWVGGAEIQTHNTANKMAELGNDIDIFLLENNKIENKKYNIIKLNKLLLPDLNLGLDDEDFQSILSYEGYQLK